LHVSGVGKSSIITRYIKGDFKKECEATIGASFMYAKVTLRDYQITLKVILFYLKKYIIIIILCVVYVVQGLGYSWTRAVS